MGNLAYTVMLVGVVVLVGVTLRAAQWAMERATVRRATAKVTAQTMHSRPRRLTR